VSPIDQRYYTSWLVGLVALGIVLLLATNTGALRVLGEVLHVLVVVLVSWAIAVALSLLPI
jgi:hypothetical protein